jgi:hypothetical protein
MKRVFFLELSRPLCFLVYCKVPDLPLLIEFTRNPAILSRGEEVGGGAMEKRVLLDGGDCWTGGGIAGLLEAKRRVEDS